MLKVTYLDLRDAKLSGWYITDTGGGMIANAHRYADQASGLHALALMCGLG